MANKGLTASDRKFLSTMDDESRDNYGMMLAYFRNHPDQIKNQPANVRKFLEGRIKTPKNK